MPPDIELSGLRLRWPRSLFLEFAEGLEQDRWSISQGLWLLRRAFDSADALTAGLEDGSAEVLSFITSHIDEIPYIYERRPLFSDRHGRGRESARPGYAWAQRTCSALLRRYHATGSLGENLQSSCPDDQTNDGDPSEALLAIVGLPGLWPLDAALEEYQNDDVFFDVLEAFDELVVMPTSRYRHGYGGCGWHYSNFSHHLGRTAYRFEVNRIFEFAGVPYRIAESGEDAGRVVAAGTDELAPLLERGAARSQEDDGADIRHAVALFRSRGATVEEKRSAVVALYRVLERRRSLLKASLFSGDEDALFTIANQFGVRHANERQRTEYDPAFLDWTFWWCLATTELIDTLLLRQE